jgi:hypothetical protein
VLKLIDIEMRTLIQTLFFTACGLFTPPEALIVNLVYFISIAVHETYFMRSVEVLLNIFQLLVFCMFNIAETYYHYSFEKRCFYHMAEANKTSIQYVKFVNRLLPTHVRMVYRRSSRTTRCCRPRVRPTPM